MENVVNIQNEQLVIEPVGLTKIAALKERIVIPLTHVVGASIDTGIINESKGFRMPGTAIPGYWAGTFRKNDEMTFLTLNTRAYQLLFNLKMKNIRVWY